MTATLPWPIHLIHHPSCQSQMSSVKTLPLGFLPPPSNPVADSPTLPRLPLALSSGDPPPFACEGLHAHAFPAEFSKQTLLPTPGPRLLAVHGSWRNHSL